MPETTEQQAADVARHRAVAEKIVNDWIAVLREPKLGDLVDAIQDELAAAEERGRLREREAIAKMVEQPGMTAETTSAHPYVPDWREVHKGSAHQYNPNEQDLIPITRETLSHALSALRTMNADDYYHNNGAAEREIYDALHHWNAAPQPVARQGGTAAGGEG